MLVQRGKCSFAQEAKWVQDAGGAAMMVVQTQDAWPYVMTDSIGEYKQLAIHIPICMISSQDAMR